MPTDAVATVIAELGSPKSTERFAHTLTEGLANQLVGLVARSET